MASNEVLVEVGDTLISEKVGAEIWVEVLAEREQERGNRTPPGINQVQAKQNLQNKFIQLPAHSTVLFKNRIPYAYVLPNISIKFNKLHPRW